MKAFDLAEAGTNALSATFFSKASDLQALKPDVVVGLKSSLKASYGLDAAPAPSLAI
jgi:hypothetical protein